MSELTPKAHTAAVLKRMNLSGSVPGNLDRNNDMGGDNYGLTSARSSDASSFGASGAPKSPHMGRPGRQSGGRITGDLVRTRRTPEETAKDIANEDKVVNSLAKDREGRKKGGRIGRDAGGPVQRTLGYSAMPTSRDQYKEPVSQWVGESGQRMRDTASAGQMEDRDVDSLIGSQYGRPDSDRDRIIGRAKGGRANRAHGGRTKGKTTVNVIIGGQKSMTPPPGPPPMPPPPMAAPGPVGPPKPPMPPPGMPMGGAPPGMGGPPPGGPPMLRARGGRIGKAWGGGLDQTTATPAAPTPAPSGGGMGQRPWGQGGGQNWGQGAQQAMQNFQQQHPQIAQAMQNWQQHGQGAGGQPPWAGMGQGGGQPPQGAPPMGQGGMGWPQGGMGPRPMMGGQQPGMMGRARGGRIEVETPGKHSYPTDGTHSFGKGGTPAQASLKRQYGGGSGLGRMEIARKEK